MKVDLHCHTTASDGSLTPHEIIDLAVKFEVKMLAITDHDTTAAYPQVADYAKQNGVQLITGVEASCLWQGHTIHLVGLNFDIHNAELQQGLQQIRELRVERAQNIIARLKARPNINIESIEDKFNEIVDTSVVGRGHVAQLLQQEKLVKNTQQAFDKYLKKGKVGYEPCKWPDLKEVVSWITAAGGIAVIAHPKLYKLSSNKLNRLIEDFKNAGGQAIEVVNQPRHSADIDGMTDRAIRYDLLASVGSDFHRPEHTWRGLGWLTPLPAKNMPVWEHFS